MSANNKPTVYRLDVPAANRHFEKMGSWYRASPTERRVIVEPTHDDYVDTVVINGNLAGSLPRRLLISTDDDIDEVIAAYKAEGHRMPGFMDRIEAARRAR